MVSTEIRDKAAIIACELGYLGLTVMKKRIPNHRPPLPQHNYRQLLMTQNAELKKNFLPFAVKIIKTYKKYLFIIKSDKILNMFFCLLKKKQFLCIWKNVD